MNINKSYNMKKVSFFFALVEWKSEKHGNKFSNNMHSGVIALCGVSRNNGNMLIVWTPIAKESKEKSKNYTVKLHWPACHKMRLAQYEYNASMEDAQSFHFNLFLVNISSPAIWQRALSSAFLFVIVLICFNYIFLEKNKKRRAP